MKKKLQPFPWQPFSVKQKRILHWWRPRSPYANKKILIADGSIRSGKTVSMILSFLLWSMATFRDRDFIIAGRSAGALKRNVLTPMFQILEGMNMEEGRHYRYHRVDGRIDIGTNRYHLFGASNEKSQDVLQGLTAAGAYADEAALFPRSFVDQMIGRCSVPGARIWMNCNPQGPRHFIKTDFIDEITNPKKSICRIHFLLEDNPTLTQETIDFYKGQFQGVFYKRNILGLWMMAEGVVYDMWDEDKYTFSELPDRRFDRTEVWIDHGQRNPTAFLLVKIEDGNHPRFWVVREYYHDGSKRQKTVRQYRNDLLHFIEGEEIDGVVIDSAATELIDELRMTTQLPVREADKDVLEGIRRVQTTIFEGRLWVHENCHNLLREFQSYVWDEKKAQRGEDEPVKKDDHCLDALRYGINTQNVQFIF